MKHKFNWLDILISALLIAALIGGMTWYFARKDNVFYSDANQPKVEKILAVKTYEITMRFTQMTTDQTDFYRVGDLLYHQGGTKVIGIVTALRVMDEIAETLDQENEKFVVSTVPDTKVVEMKVEVRGVIDDHILKVNGEMMHIGKGFYPQSKKTRSTMTIWSIKEVA